MSDVNDFNAALQTLVNHPVAQAHGLTGRECKELLKAIMGEPPIAVGAEAIGAEGAETPSPANSNEISVLTEEEFVGLWANSTWSRSTFQFLKREGLQITKATKPVSVSLEKLCDDYSTKMNMTGDQVESMAFALDAAGVPYVD